MLQVSIITYDAIAAYVDAASYHTPSSDLSPRPYNCMPPDCGSLVDINVFIDDRRVVNHG